MSLSFKSETENSNTSNEWNILGSDIALVREEKPDHSTEDVDTTILSEEVIIQDDINSPELESTGVASENVSETPLRYCKNCGSVIDGISKKCTGCGKQYFKLPDTPTLICCILTIAIICLSMYCLSQQDEIQMLNIELDDAYEEANDYRVLYRNHKRKADYLDNELVFVIEGYGDYYYTYDQMNEVTAGKGSYSYWVYFRSSAIRKGYQAWR